MLTSVEKLRERSLAWVHKNINQFENNLTLDKGVMRIKPFGELLFTILPTLRYGEESAIIDSIISTVLRMLNRIDLESELARDPSAWLIFCPTILEFAIVTGANHSVPVTTLSTMIDRGAARAREQVPHRCFDLEYTLNRASLAHEPDFATLYRATGMGRRRMRPLFSRMDLYAVTHTVFYLTDMGFRDPALLLSADELDYARQVVRFGTAISIVDRDADILAEMLFCWAVLRDTPSELSNAGWQYLNTWQREDGALPAPTYLKFPQKGDATTSDWFKCYHTTLVGMMASTAWLHTQAGAIHA